MDRPYIAILSKSTDFGAATCTTLKHMIKTYYTAQLLNSVYYILQKSYR